MVPVVRGALAAVVFFSATPASAEYLSNRGDWDELKATKGTYVMGAVDLMTMTLEVDSPQVKAQKARHLNCLARVEMQPGQLAKLMDEEYARQTENWKMQPSAILLQVVMNLCR